MCNYSTHLSNIRRRNEFKSSYPDTPTHCNSYLQMHIRTNIISTTSQDRHAR